jgi:hypothetical protein
MKKVNPGQKLRIPASTYNAFIDAAVAHQKRAHDVSASDAVRTPSATALVRNDTGVAQGRFAVLGIAGFIIEPADNLDGFHERTALVGVAPIAAGSEGVGELHTEDSFAILAEPLDDGEIGRAWIHGAAPVLVDVDDESHRYAKLVHGETGHLITAESGPVVILWREATDVVPVWAVVRWGSANAGQMAFPVNLVQVGGTQGTDSTAASWTYDVFGLDDAVAALVEDAAPTTSPHQWRRPTLGEMSQATFGYAHWQSDGEGGRELVLGWINEVPLVAACPEP